MDTLLELWFDTSASGVAFLEPVYREEEAMPSFFCQKVNTTLARQLGKTPDECNGQPIGSLVLWIPQAELDKQIRTVFESGEPQKHHYHDPEGDRWFGVSLVRLAGQVVISFLDVTEHRQPMPRKWMLHRRGRRALKPNRLAKSVDTSMTRHQQVEEELRKANLELEQRVTEQTAEVRQLAALQGAILKYVGLGVAATDTRGVIRLVNPALEAMTGYRADELVGKRTTGALREPVLHQQQIDQLKRDLNDPSLQGEATVAAYVARHHFLRLENTLLTKDGSIIPVLSTVSGLYDEQNALMGYVDINTDISYLKAVEEALMQASQRSQLATKAGKLGIWEWNLLTHELILDENFYALMGVPQGRTLTQISDIELMVHPHDRTLFMENVETIIREQTDFDVELRIVSPIDQSIRYMKVDGLVLQNESGLSYRMIGVIQDQTARRQANQALRISEQRYRSLVDHLKDVVFQASLEGVWTYLNPAWEVITGFSMEESMGCLVQDFIAAEDHPKIQSLFAPVDEGQPEFRKQVVRCCHKAGGHRWMEVFAQLSRNQQEEVVGISGTLTDITDRKQAEEALIESEQRFREIAENVEQMFWIRDVNSPVFLYMNPIFEYFSGTTVEALYKDPLIFAKSIVEEDRPAILAAFISNETKSTFQFRINHPDGSLRWIDAKVFVLTNEDGVPVRRLGVATDVTTAIEKEQILEESLAKERALNVLKSQFITTASHEFRTPLASILSSIELVKYYSSLDDLPTARASITKHADSVSKQVMALTDLIADTLTISKIDEGRIKPQLELTDLVTLTEELVAFNFGNREDRRQVGLAVSGTPVPVCIDKKLMDHVLTNLLSNAFKFSASNPRLTIRFEPAAVLLSVIDRGIGVPRQDLPRLFSKFFRAGNVAHIKGTGLGLAICLEYITLQKGKIDIASTEGVGTTFTITLPLADSQSAHVQPS